MKKPTINLPIEVNSTLTLDYLKKKIAAVKTITLAEIEAVAGKHFFDEKLIKRAIVLTLYRYKFYNHTFPLESIRRCMKVASSNNIRHYLYKEVSKNKLNEWNNNYPKFEDEIIQILIKKIQNKIL